MDLKYKDSGERVHAKCSNILPKECITSILHPYYLNLFQPHTGDLKHVQAQVSKHVLHAIYDQPFKIISSTGATQDSLFQDLYSRS